MIGTYIIQMVKMTRAHIGIAVLPSFWLGSLFALILGFQFNLLVFLLGFFIIFLVYAAAAYSNEYYDFQADQYNRQFGFSGGSGVLQQYPQLKQAAKWSAVGFLLLAILITGLLALTTYIPLWSVGFISIGVFFSWFYSAPPFRFSYRGMSEFPHFLAGMMNTSWGYLLVAGTIDISLVIFAIPLSLHLLNVILIFEIPDREADIHGGKKNFIVTRGRQRSYLLISIIFWLSTVYFLVLSILGWYTTYINFWLITVLSMFPSLIATSIYITKPLEEKATPYAIRTALSLFTFSILMITYFIFLQF